MLDNIPFICPDLEIITSCLTVPRQWMGRDHKLSNIVNACDVLLGIFPNHVMASCVIFQ